MKYITTKRFKKNCLSGEVNIAYNTECECIDGIIFYKRMPLCYTTSQNAYDYFSCNDDGCGLERGSLVNEIKARLAKRDSKHQDRWDKMWEDGKICKLRRQEIPDHWIWSYDFYNASIEDLKYILNKIKEVK